VVAVGTRPLEGLINDQGGDLVFADALRLCRHGLKGYVETKDGRVMSATETSTTRGVRADYGPADAFTSVLNAAVGSAAAKLEQKVVKWADKLNGVAGDGDSSEGLAALADAGLDELAEGGGAKEKAGVEGVKAALHGRNPIWAAIKGAWQAGTPVVRAAIVAAVASAILLLLLSPVVLVVFLLSLLIIAAVHRARRAKV
jgi:hypothetical protein